MACRNHPDIDLADAALNTSGVPWHTLYYEGSYPRLQRIKARWTREMCSGTRCPFGGLRHESR